MTRAAQLVADLVERADMTVDAVTEARWWITRYDRETFTPPVLLVWTDDDLEARLDASAEDAAFLFPDVPARVGAYRLLLVHLEEALLSMTPPTEIRITADGVRVLTVSRSPPAGAAPGRS